MNILINNLDILTLTGDYLENTCLCIEKDRILSLGDVPEDFKPDYTIEGKNCLALPGLVNAHSHVAMSLFRNYADDMNLQHWLQDKIWPIEALLTAEDVYYGSLLSIGEMIRSGVTAFADMYFFEEETAKAVLETGVRGNLSQGLISFTDGMKKLQDNIELFEVFHNQGEGRLRISIGPHAPNTVDDALFKACVKEADRIGATLHVHLSESLAENEESMEKYGMSPTKRLEKLGVFDVPCVAAHGVYVDEEDRLILKEKDVTIVHNPSSNLKLASGIAPIQEILEAGVNVALGTDGSSSNNNQNMWEEMHIAGLIGKVESNNPTAMPAKEVLNMATVNGAKAWGWKSAGTIEVGKKADIVLIRRDAFHHYPRFNPYSELVYSTQASDVDTVIVNGKILMEHGELKTIDEEKVKWEVEKRAKRLAAEV